MKPHHHPRAYLEPYGQGQRDEACCPRLAQVLAKEHHAALHGTTLATALGQADGQPGQLAGRLLQASTPGGGGGEGKVGEEGEGRGFAVTRGTLRRNEEPFTILL